MLAARVGFGWGLGLGCGLLLLVSLAWGQGAAGAGAERAGAGRAASGPEARVASVAEAAKSGDGAEIWASAGQWGVMQGLTRGRQGLPPLSSSGVAQSDELLRAGALRLQESFLAQGQTLERGLRTTYLQDWLMRLGLSPALAAVVELGARLLFFVLAMAVLARLLRWSMRQAAKATLLRRLSKARQAAAIDQGLFRWAGHLLVGGTALALAPLVFGESVLMRWVSRALEIWVLVAGLFMVSRLVRVVLATLTAQRPQRYQQVPLRSIEQVVDLVLALLGVVTMVSMLAGTNPLVIVSGFGAFSAVLLLIFKDSILGFVASLQLAANGMVRRGDWITVGTQVDGTVEEITLTAVRVANFDRTTAYLPPTQLVTEPFVNWRTVTTGSGRRVRRTILLDLRTIAPLTTQQQQDLAQLSLLRDYLDGKARELTQWRADQDGHYPRELTNLGTFRVYCQRWIKAQPWVQEGLAVVVSELDPTAEGLPLRLSFFSRNTAGVDFEGDQSETLEHVMAMLPRFGLRAFQVPAGDLPPALAQADEARAEGETGVDLQAGAAAVAAGAS